MKSPRENGAIEWVAKADSDLAYARLSFENFDDFYGQMCVLCHDAAEKYLKAFLVSRGIRPKYIHDLVALLGECTKVAKEFENCRDDCERLNTYYVPLKYPSHYPAPERNQARDAIDSAARISDTVHREIGIQ